MRLRLRPRPRPRLRLHLHLHLRPGSHPRLPRLPCPPAGAGSRRRPPPPPPLREAQTTIARVARRPAPAPYCTSRPIVQCFRSRKRFEVDMTRVALSKGCVSPGRVGAWLGRTSPRGTAPFWPPPRERLFPAVAASAELPFSQARGRQRSQRRGTSREMAHAPRTWSIATARKSLTTHEGRKSL